MTQTQRNAALLAKIRAYTEEHTRSREAAWEALVREGFFLADGSVAPQFAPQPEGKVAA